MSEHVGTIPVELVLRACEALLEQTTPEDRGDEVIFQGVPIRYAVIVNNDMMFERHMLVGRDWNCGFNLVHTDLAVHTEDTRSYTAFAATFVIRQIGMEGEEGFNRDMTVLRMTYNDWRLENQPETIGEG